MPSPVGSFSPASLYGATNSFFYLKYNGPSFPQCGDYAYPIAYLGSMVGTIDSTDAIEGSSCLVNYYQNPGDEMYINWNPYNFSGNPSYPNLQRGFARQYGETSSSSWQFNTYNRWSFWVQRPVNSEDNTSDINFYDIQLGTYVKQVTQPSPDNCDNGWGNNDECGGNHYYFLLGMPSLGSGIWTQVVLNFHPSHERSAPVDPGVVQYPCAVGGPNGGTDPANTYNMWDCLTRWYWDDSLGLTGSDLSGLWRFDNMWFWETPYTENEQQVFNLTSTYVPATNRLIVTWCVDWAATVDYDVAYAFSSIHSIGWSSATIAPSGSSLSTGNGAYNGMTYDNSTLPLSGHQTVYIGIKPQGSSLFAEIAVPLNINSTGSPTLSSPNECIENFGGISFNVRPFIKFGKNLRTSGGLLFNR